MLRTENVFVFDRIAGQQMRNLIQVFFIIQFWCICNVQNNSTVFYGPSCIQPFSRTSTKTTQPQALKFQHSLARTKNSSRERKQTYCSRGQVYYWRSQKVLCKTFLVALHNWSLTLSNQWPICKRVPLSRNIISSYEDQFAHTHTHRLKVQKINVTRH